MLKTSVESPFTCREGTQSSRTKMKYNCGRGRQVIFILKSDCGRTLQCEQDEITEIFSACLFVSAYKALIKLEQENKNVLIYL